MINYTNPRPPAQRHPLRSVNENVALLRSPDPLESMLKTTTETGDIGIFSIGPNSSSAPFARPKRSRSHPREAHLPLPARSLGYDDGYYCRPDSPKRLRSYRDTTSEIISLYGSESQKTLLSSVSPTSIDDDPRSYSMTTTSSKRIPSQKSTGTLQSQSSGGGFQRPRSPFPYPTRLKRPGVRPASPALRENGDIDYSRMVELDRFSQRTIHGSYKPTYAHGPRRPLPMAFRPDVNRSASSLPSRTLHSPYLYAPVPCHARGPNPSLPWGLPRQANRHQRGSIDQSTRSASLTSIVEMYDRPVTSNSNCVPPPVQSPGSFYYDYSEQFEDQPPWDMDLDVPLHPIPQRVENIRHSLLLLDNIQGSFEVSGNYPDSIKSNVQEVGKASIEPSRLSDAADGNSEDNQAQQPTSKEEDGAMERPSLSEPSPKGTPLITLSDEGQSQPLILSNQVSPDADADATDILSMTSDSTSLGSPAPLQTPSKILETNFNVASESWSQRSSRVGLPKLRYSLDPALSEFASVLSSFDRLGRIQVSKDSDMQSVNGGCHDTSVYQQDDVHAATLKRSSRRPSPTTPGPADEEDGVYLKCHRRNVAAMRISITGIVPDGIVMHTPERHNNLGILCPEPISPVRELRVKESIPQLMKALPPLPREAEKLSGYGTAGTPALNGYSGHAGLMLDKECTAAMKRPLETRQTSSSPAISRLSQDFHPKLKLRARAPSSSPGKGGNVLCSVTTVRRTYAGSHDHEYGPAVRPKLKLKIPRSQAQPGNSGLSPYNNRLKQCNSLAELAPCLKKSATDEHIRIDMGGKTQASSIGSTERDMAAMEEQSIRLEPSPQLSDQFNIPYPPSPARGAARSSHPATSANEEEEVEICSSRAGRPRGLRGKLSVLRLRFASPQSYATAPEETFFVPYTDKKSTSIPPAAASKDTDGSHGAEIGTTNQPLPVEEEKVRRRVKQWARDVKKAVRLYVKRTWERSPKVKVDGHLINGILIGV
ncbi:uncharacterized protein Triagg1_3005 [Trichoderma aggressivum f. europaeum]|uniref:Uncharacterized protein n=1 Tax=Trichoderma aggressivum f. europaeum TaxID=173218 RepID=A0AAE1M1K2_9HYPO|nr:hypothetical protein Triagg1_3005 [Trichoderma aggressivum f. europaeum]